MTFYKDIDNLKATEQLAKLVASNIKGGEVIELVSDVGGGKTTFTKYLVAALGSNDTVSSPTFTVNKVYNTPKHKVYHYDFYRLNDPMYVSEALAENLDDTTAITLVEWGGLVDNVLPKERIKITIQKHATNQDARHITIQAPDSLAYVVKGIA